MRYCPRCNRKLDTELPSDFVDRYGNVCENTLDWCDGCNDLVEFTTCKVPAWAITVTLGMFCWVQM